MMDELQPKIVAAIDFGTCNTRMAFAEKQLVATAADVEVVVMDDWKHTPGARTTPTSVLIDHTGSVISYGYEAEEMYGTMKPADQRSCYLFKNFKMDLHRKEKFSEDYHIEAINGGSAKAIDIFAKALRYLADRLIKFISETTEVEIVNATAEIQWVLTVPAIWQPGARQFMRNAAVKAGICNVSTRKRLIIALEPECASLHVRSQKDRHGTARSMKYGVVDCGGGTVDIVYHSLAESENNAEGQTFIVREIVPPSGGPYGGTLADTAFQQLLEPVFQRGQSLSFFEMLKKTHTAVWLSLMKQLEERKNFLDHKRDEDKVLFDLSIPFNKACQQITGRDVLSLLEDSQVEGIGLSATGQLEVQAKLIKGLYTSSVNEICTCLKNDLKEGPASKVGTLYMVGTFSTSRYLLDAVKDEVALLVPKERVINPPESSLAIVKGAVMYGINPSIVQERVAARSYGLRVLDEFDSTKHPQAKAKFYNGKKYCCDVYREFVANRQKIRNTGEVIKRTYVPVEPDQTSLCLGVYSAPDTVSYVDDKTCTHMASIVVDMPDLTGGTDRHIFVEIEFDGPEIHVVATNESSGKSYDASLEFIYDKESV